MFPESIRAMRADFVLRVIRQAIERGLAGERGMNFDRLGAELATLVRDEWIDPETGKRRPVPKRCRMRAIAAALELLGFIPCRRSSWPEIVPAVFSKPTQRLRKRPAPRRVWF